MKASCSMFSLRLLHVDRDGVRGARPWILAAEGYGCPCLNIGGRNSDRKMCVVNIVSCARRTVPENGGTRKEATSVYGEVEISASSCDGVVVCAVERWRWIAYRLCRQDERAAEQEDLRRLLRARRVGIRDDIRQSILCPARSRNVRDIAGWKLNLLFESEMLRVKSINKA